MLSLLKKVFVSGKFAVIHSGHIRLFIAAKNLGLKLIVGLDTEGLDNSEIELKLVATISKHR